MTATRRKSSGEGQRSPVASRLLRLGLTTLLAATVALAGTVVWLALNNASQPSVRLLLEADLSQLPTSTARGDAMQQIQGILERRAMTFGATGSVVSSEDADRLSITLRDIDIDGARALLLKTGVLEIREPVLDENGAVSCRAPNGTTFVSPPENILYVPVPASVTRLPVCVDSGGQRGEIIWEPANASGRAGETPALDGEFIQPDGAIVLSAGRPVLVAQFDPDGATLLSQITERLVNLPLGVFLDGELLFGPTVKEPITDGRLDIFGLSLHDARIVASQLNAGPLPAPVREVPPEGSP